MATSLCFGLIFSTVLILVLVPTFYMIHARITGEVENGLGLAEAEAGPHAAEGKRDGMAGAVISTSATHAVPLPFGCDDLVENPGPFPDSETGSETSSENDTDSGNGEERTGGSADRNKKVLASGVVSPEAGQGQNLRGERQSPPR